MIVSKQLFKSVVGLVLSLLLIPDSTGAEQIHSNLVVRIDGHQLPVYIPAVATDQGTARRLLNGRVREAILDSLKAEAGIKIPPARLSKCVDVCFEFLGVTSAQASHVVSDVSQLYEAVRQVVVDGSDPKDVYDDALKEVATPSEWNVWVQEYDSVEKLEKLKPGIPTSLDDMKRQTEAGLRSQLETWMLYEEVTREISATDQQIMEMYQRLFPSGSPALLSVQQSVEKLAELEARMQFFEEWWMDNLQARTIEFPPGYTDCLDLLRKPMLPSIPEPVIGLLTAD